MDSKLSNSRGLSRPVNCEKGRKKRNASLPIDCSVNIVDTLCCDQCESSSIVAVMIRGCELLMQKRREKVQRDEESVVNSVLQRPYETLWR